MADSARRDLRLMVAEGPFFGGVRGEILNLMERIDDIADNTGNVILVLLAKGYWTPQFLTGTGIGNPDGEGCQNPPDVTKMALKGCQKRRWGRQRPRLNRQPLRSALNTDPPFTRVFHLSLSACGTHAM
ncbi:MAG: DUF47 family protein [Nitrososphaerota archaeon]|nr:DUF47 family protein [Nitrososphaerota archaeon]